jgi:hypothetical protein
MTIGWDQSSLTDSNVQALFTRRWQQTQPPKHNILFVEFRRTDKIQKAINTINNKSLPKSAHSLRIIPILTFCLQYIVPSNFFLPKNINTHLLSLC